MASAAKSPIPSAYLAARREWDERYGDVLARARNWRLFAFGLLILCGGLAAGNFWQLTRSKFTTFIVAVDALGRVVAAGPADHKPVAEDRMKRAALSEWVSAWRGVSSDVAMQARLIRNAVYSRVASGSKALTQLAGFYDPARGGASPFERAKTETVEVQVESILPTGERTYEVRWREITRDLNGEVQRQVPWVAAITIVVNPPVDEPQAILNSLGIYVTDVTWSQVKQ